MSASTPPSHLGLGLDAGGTATRWALADAQGRLVAQGRVDGFSGLQLADAAGTVAVGTLLGNIARDIARDVAAQGATATIGAICAGVTGFDGDDAAPLAAVMSRAFGVPLPRIVLYNDIELACRAAFAPGMGYLVYAGTGSVAAFIDAKGVQHRAGGRGGLIDDGGGGYWIAREALRHVWRTEDEEPGAWHRSALAQRIFDVVGGSDWSCTRRWVYGASRGQLGELALAVAAAADDDAAAREILQRAGAELARLGLALIHRHGRRPVALAGRVLSLHPCIEAALRDAMPAAEVHGRIDIAAHVTAATLAAAQIDAMGTPA